MADAHGSSCTGEGFEDQLVKQKNSVSPLAQKEISTRPVTDGDGDDNIILNPRFDDGLNNWSGKGCKILLHDSMGDGKILPLSGKSFASATERTQNWHGIQQEVTGRLQRKLAYEVTAAVRIFGSSTPADVRATLYVQAPNGREQYISIAKLQASDKDWVQLQGKFLVNGVVSKSFIFVEGPPPGTDILLNSLVVKHAQKNPPPSPPDTKNVLYGVNIITNSDLSDGLNGWFPLGPCTLSVSSGSPHVFPPMARDSLGTHEPLNGSCILVTNRTQSWMGPAQTITDKLNLHLTYQVSAWVRVSSVTNGPQNINVALGVDSQWVNGGQVEAKDERWYEIGGSLKVDEKSDVYSFGVVLLELITGRKPVGDFGEEGLDIVQWAKMNTNWSKEGVVKILDRRLTNVPLEESMQMFFVGMLCVQERSIERPTMREVVQMLEQAKQSCRFRAS